MGKCLLLALLVLASDASAEPIVVEDTEAATVYRDGAQIVVLVAGRYGDVFDFAMERAPEKLRYPKRVADKEARDAGVKMYQTRIRSIGPDLVCEKVAIRPKSPDSYAVVVAALLSAPC